jgi:hypothetical protein
MRNKEILDLMEAYASIYNSQEEVEQLDEGEKPFPHEKVEAKQKSLRDKGGNSLERRMKMGAARRRAKEAEKTGGSQQSAGAGWYHAKEETDLFDYILEHLVAEGYADTNEAAIAIMANMSEEWKQSILEADSLEAMRARREKRLAAQRKREGRPTGGGDFGHDYSKPQKGGGYLDAIDKKKKD